MTTPTDSLDDLKAQLNTYCWIFVCWLQFCLKQIFISDVEHDVPTSRHGLCVMYLALFYARVFLFTESTPPLVLVNLRVFIRRSEQM